MSKIILRTKPYQDVLIEISPGKYRCHGTPRGHKRDWFFKILDEFKPIKEHRPNWRGYYYGRAHYVQDYRSSWYTHKVTRGLEYELPGRVFDLLYRLCIYGGRFTPLDRTLSLDEVLDKLEVIVITRELSTLED
jgi:hypothetical protein